MKTIEWWNEHSRDFNITPQVAFIITTHNMANAMIGIIRALRNIPFAEIIVAEDGSETGNTDILLNELTGVNEYLLRFNDLFEVNTVNRAVRFAAAPYVCVLQDDDTISGLEWVFEAVKLFEKYPRLGILGGRDAVDVTRDGIPHVTIWCRDTEHKFQYVQSLNSCPIWFRRDKYIELGGWGQDFSPFLWHEADLCFRAWLAGVGVGWYYADGMHNLALDNIPRRDNRASLLSVVNEQHRQLIITKYADKLDYINGLVKIANEGK